MSISAEDITRFLSETFDLDGDSLDSDVPLFSSGLLDSTSMVELVVFLETRTGVEVDAEDLTLENFDTVDSVLAFYGRAVG